MEVVGIESFFEGGKTISSVFGTADDIIVALVLDVEKDGSDWWPVRSEVTGLM